MPDLPPPTVYDPARHSYMLDALAQLHHDCIVVDGMLANFLDVSDRSKLIRYWEKRHKEVIAGGRIIIMQFADVNETELAGVVMLGMPESETGPFRAFVEKLMTSPQHRRKGVARVLMQKLEQEAMSRDRGLLMLDTTVGSGADLVYPRLGYESHGIVPKYGISPVDGKLVDGAFFSKDLRDQK